MGERCDVVVIGAGIVGLAAARAVLLDQPSSKVIVVDKEAAPAAHQTGRNSGVIHAGVYYRPGSAKAEMCVEGRVSMVRYCEERGIPHEVCGKLVVATNDVEVERLHELEQRCRTNGVEVRRLGPEGIREIEPYATGVEALHVLSTGIVDYKDVCRALRSDVEDLGGVVRLSSAVLGGAARNDSIVVETDTGQIEARRVVNCAGLHADRLARLFGGEQATGGLRIIPFRGEYYNLVPGRQHLVRGLIYPAPDPLFPFLGVHLTRGIDGRVHTGPNAVLALAREGYTWGRISPRDLGEMARFGGFRRLARQHWRYGVSEMVRSLSRRRFAAALARLVPEVVAADLDPAPSGVRAQAVHADGRLADDFELTTSNDGRVFNVLNAPSPAATASLVIGQRIARWMSA